MERGAVFCKSDESDNRYRYLLWRTWDTTLPRLLYIMLNPSSADEKDDDPTIKKCIGFAERLGFGSFEVVNLYSLISTDPGNLRTSPDPIGKETDRYILDAAKRANAIILAWGCNHFSEKRDDYIVSMLRNAGYQLSCLKKNEDGCPSHPLFLGFKLVDGKDFKTMNPF